MQGGIRLDDEREWKLRFLEERVCGGNSIKSRADVFRRTVGVGRRGNTRLQYISKTLSLAPKQLTLGGKIIGGGGNSSSATLKGVLSRSVG